MKKSGIHWGIRGLAACVMLTLLVDPSPVSADSITLESGSFIRASSGTWPNASSSGTTAITAPPSTGTASAFGSSTSYDFPSLLLFTATMGNTTSSGGTYAESEGWLRFTANEDLTAEISATYGSTSESHHTVFLRVEVTDVTGASSLVFREDKSGTSTEPVSLNSSTSLLLQQGRMYQFYFDSFIRNNGGSLFDQASGSVRFSLAPTGTVVPLPAAVWGGLALMGLCVTHRLRRGRCQSC